MHSQQESLKMKWRALYFFILIGIQSPITHAQDSTIRVFTYQLIDNNTLDSIPYAHIYNESRRYGAIADSTGSFNIKASTGDTLVLLALGYLGTYYQVNSIDSVTITQLKMLARNYTIDEVSIVAPQSYEQFQQKFLNEVPVEEKIIPQLPSYNKYKTPYLLDTNITHTVGFMIFHPVSGLYYRFSKVEKSKRKVWYAKQQELRQQEVDEKFNRALVTEITGYTGDELTQFIAFCNFTFNYLLETSPLDIILAIEVKNKQYIECCYDKPNNDSHP